MPRAGLCYRERSYARDELPLQGYTHPWPRDPDVRLERGDRANAVAHAFAGCRFLRGAGELAVRSRCSRFPRPELSARERGGLVELDHELVDGDVRAAEVAEVPFDALTDAERDFLRNDPEVHAAAVHFDVDAHRNGANGELRQIAGAKQTIGRRRRCSDQRRRFRTWWRGDER